MKKLFRISVLILFATISYAQRDTVIIRPAPINDVLQNPNMGVTTFNRFNGQSLNPELKWSELGPVTKLPQAATRPDFPDTTIAYLRWYWNALEPERGKYRWDILDLALSEARAQRHAEIFAVVVVFPAERARRVEAIQADEPVLPCPGHTGLFVQGVGRELVTAGDDDHLGVEIERAPFHRAAVDDRPVLGFQAKSGAGIRQGRVEAESESYGQEQVQRLALW